jgi:hypothetical protein
LDYIAIIAVFFCVNSCDTGKHLGEVSLDIFNLFTVANNFEQIFISHKVKASEVLSLFFKVLTQGFLNMLKLCGEVGEGFFKVGNFENFKYVGVLVYSLHQPNKVVIDVLELCELIA